MRISVVLPAPFSPTMPIRSPGFITSVRSRRRLLAAERLADTFFGARRSSLPSRGPVGSRSPSLARHAAVARWDRGRRGDARRRSDRCAPWPWCGPRLRRLRRIQSISRRMNDTRWYSASASVASRSACFNEELGVVAVVRVDLAAIDLEDARRHAIEEVAIVGDHDQRAGPRGEPDLEPLHGLGIEVVGGLRRARARRRVRAARDRAPRAVARRATAVPIDRRRSAAASARPRLVAISCAGISSIGGTRARARAIERHTSAIDIELRFLRRRTRATRSRFHVTTPASGTSAGSSRPSRPSRPSGPRPRQRRPSRRGRASRAASTCPRRLRRSSRCDRFSCTANDAPISTRRDCRTDFSRPWTVRIARHDGTTKAGRGSVCSSRYASAQQVRAVPRGSASCDSRDRRVACDRRASCTRAAAASPSPKLPGARPSGTGLAER